MTACVSSYVSFGLLRQKPKGAEKKAEKLYEEEK